MRQFQWIPTIHAAKQENVENNFDEIFIWGHASRIVPRILEIFLTWCLNCAYNELI